jgi:hypothetical protein
MLRAVRSIAWLVLVDTRALPRVYSARAPLARLRS